MSELLSSLNNVFIILCDSFGLNSHQLERLVNSAITINNAVDNYNNDDHEGYLESYTVLSQILISGQENGVFELEVASRVYNSLLTVKTYLTEKKVSDDLVVDNKYLSTVIERKILSNNFFTIDQIRLANKSLLTLEHVLKENTITTSDLNLDYMQAFNNIYQLVELSQKKGKMTLSQADQTLKLLTNVKKHIMQYNMTKSRPNLEIIKEESVAEMEDEMETDTGSEPAPTNVPDPVPTAKTQSKMKPSFGEKKKINNKEKYREKPSFKKKS